MASRNPETFGALAMLSGDSFLDMTHKGFLYEYLTSINGRSRLVNLRKLHAILLDVGTSDDYQLQWGHRLLSHYLRESGIAHEYTENAGNHGGRSRERIQVALQWLAGVLAGEAV